MIRKLATGLAANRVLFGIGFLAAPASAGRSWIGKPARLRQTQVFTRALGVRDLVLGAGALAALADDRADPRPWFAAQAVADATDLIATLAAARALPRSGYRFALATAGTSTAVAVAATLGLGREDDRTTAEHIGGGIGAAA